MREDVESFVVMRSANALGRDFVGCDIAFDSFYGEEPQRGCGMTVKDRIALDLRQIELAIRIDLLHGTRSAADRGCCAKLVSALISKKFSTERRVIAPGNVPGIHRKAHRKEYSHVRRHYKQTACHLPRRR